MNLSFVARGTPAEVAAVLDEQQKGYTDRYGDDFRVVASMRRFIDHAIAPARPDAIVTVRATASLGVTVEYAEPPEAVEKSISQRQQG